jgi:uncharacterized protein
MRRSWLLVPLVLLLPLLLFAQAPPTDEGKVLREYVTSQYTKYEYEVPMRDGVKLFTVAYVPKDTKKSYPILMHRTPYGVGPYGVDNYNDRVSNMEAYLKAGYILVNQDVRGRMKSEGKFVDMRPHNPAKKEKEIDESSDTYDSIDWLLKKIPGHNGRVGILGISYPGFYAAAALVDAHPALKAASPQAPVMDFFDGDDWRHNGALLLIHNFGFEQVFNKMTPQLYRKSGSTDFDFGTNDGYQFFLDMGPLANADKKHFKGVSPFWNEVMQHPNYDDYCKAKDLRPHIKNVKPAVLTVGGWYDAEDLAGPLNLHRRISSTSPDCPANLLVMGPWVHGGWSRGDGDTLGPLKFPSKPGEWYRKEIEFPFFEQHLKDVKATGLPKSALMYETGTNRWRSFDTWPPKDAEKVTFHFGAGSSFNDSPSRVQKQLDSESRATINKKLNDLEGFDEFVSDPAKPVPYIERNNTRMDKEYMIADQRFAGRRPDVLVYKTPVFKEDVTIAGPIEVELHVSTTGTDADWVVKLIDVYPDDYPELDPNPTNVKMSGYQQLIRGEPFRGKFRNSMAKPEPFEPGKPTVVKFTMPDVSHSFRAGHRLMVQVQSSWFPFIDRNPQTFCDIGTATEADFKKATHRVYHSTAMPSGVSVRVVK